MARADAHQRIDAAFRSWARFVIRHRVTVLLASLAVSACLIAGLTRLHADFSSDSFLLQDDTALETYNAFRDQYGREDTILIGLAPAEVFDLDFLAYLQNLHEAIEHEVPHVSEVTSLINVRSTRGEADELIVEDLFERWPSTATELNVLRERAVTNPVYLNHLLSEDLRFTTIVIELETYSSLADEEPDLPGQGDPGTEGEPFVAPEYLTDWESDQVVSALHTLLDAHAREGVRVSLVGGPVIGNHIEGIARGDATLYTPASILMIALLLGVLFRRVSAALLPNFVVFLSMASSFGVMGWLDMPYSAPTQVLITFLMAVGTCDAVHILAILYQGLARGLSREEAIVEALGHSGLAVTLTSLTTAGGLFSFVAAEFAPIADLGIISPIGVLLALAFTLTLLPATLACLPLRAGDETGRGVPGTLPIVDRTLTHFGSLAIGYPRQVLAVTAILVLVAGFGVRSIRFSDDALDWLFEDDPVRMAVHEIDAALGGTQSLEVIIDTGVENGLYEPKVLADLERAANLVVSFDDGPVRVGSTLSILDILRETHRALNENRPEFYAIPQERALIAQELLLFENSGSEDLEKVTDSRFESARLSLRVGWTDGRVYAPFLETIGRELRALFGPSITVTLTGGASLSGRAADILLSSLARSYTLALLVITPIMILLLGGVRRGLIAMIPNLIPIWFSLGLAGYLDIPLNMSTLLVGSMIIGVAVDDTIHFMHQYDRDYSEAGDSEGAIRRTLRSTGSALLVTSLVLTGSFLISLFGRFNGMVHFGVLAAFATVVAFLADVIVAPALVHLTTRPPSETPKPEN
jgi:predicted RND superfamily exporter protein